MGDVRNHPGLSSHVGTMLAPWGGPGRLGGPCRRPTSVPRSRPVLQRVLEQAHPPATRLTGGRAAGEKWRSLSPRVSGLFSRWVKGLQGYFLSCLMGNRLDGHPGPFSQNTIPELSFNRSRYKKVPLDRKGVSQLLQYRGASVCGPALPSRRSQGSLSATWLLIRTRLFPEAGTGHVCSRLNH